VKDTTGNTQSAFPSQSFATGTGTDLVAPTIVLTTPTPGQTGVPVNTTVRVLFSKATGPGSFDPNTSFVLYDPSNVVVPATITFSPDYKTATLQPKANLNANATYTMYVGWPYVSYYLNDFSGNHLYGTNFSFMTHPGASPGTVVSCNVPLTAGASSGIDRFRNSRACVVTGLCLVPAALFCGLGLSGEDAGAGGNQAPFSPFS
jgi:Bacterial Ig-like domain